MPLPAAAAVMARLTAIAHRAKTAGAAAGQASKAGAIRAGEATANAVRRAAPAVNAAEAATLNAARTAGQTARSAAGRVRSAAGRARTAVGETTVKAERSTRAVLGKMGETMAANPLATTAAIGVTGVGANNLANLLSTEDPEEAIASLADQARGHFGRVHVLEGSMDALAQGGQATVYLPTEVVEKSGIMSGMHNEMTPTADGRGYIAKMDEDQLGQFIGAVQSAAADGEFEVVEVGGQASDVLFRPARGLMG